MKKYTMILLLLIIILGILWCSMNNYKEGLDEPTISAGDAKALASSFKQQMAAAGIPQAKSNDMNDLFDQLTSLVTQEVAATNYSQAVATEDENNTPTVNTVVPPIPFPDTSFFMGSKFGDAFCSVDNTSPSSLNQKCSTLTSDNCNATDCCIWVNGAKCVAGNAQGPTYIGGASTDADYYSYKYQCYGNCASSPEPASSCHGWDCTIETQRCLSGTPGASDSNWTCINKKWIKDNLIK
jgi:hypothetical protein